MALDKLVDSTQLDADLTSVANAIRTKGGTSAQLAFPAGFVSAVEAIETGGEGGSVQTGTFTVASNISVSAGGITLPVGFSGHPDYIYCWMDKDTFASLSEWNGNRWYRWSLVKNGSDLLQSYPPIRDTASKDVQSRFASSEYVLSVGASVFASTDADNAIGYSLGLMSYAQSNVSVNKINQDGTLKLARFSSSSSIILAGTYHFVAVTGIELYQS